MSPQNKKLWTYFLWMCDLKLFWPTFGNYTFLRNIDWLPCLWWIQFQLSWEAWLPSPLKIINHNMECFALDLKIANSSGFCFGSSVCSITMPQKTFQLTLFSYYAFFMAWKADTWYWFGCIYFGMLHDIHKVRIFIHLKFQQIRKTSLSIFICLWILMEK